MSNAISHHSKPRPQHVGQAELAKRQKERVIQDIPVMLKSMYQQMDAVRKITSEQMNILQNLRDVEGKNNTWLMSIHDRLDSLIVETRVSNMLMSEFLELQKVIITEDVVGKAKDKRDILYHQARNGG